MLVRDPFNLTFPDIAKLTDDQISDILFHPRDKEGYLDIGSAEDGGGSDESISFGKMYEQVMRLHNPSISDDEIKASFVKEYGEPDMPQDYADKVRSELAEMWETLPEGPDSWA